MRVNQSKNLNECNACGEVLQGGKCLSCLYFETVEYSKTYTGDVLSEVGEDVKAETASLVGEDKITCSARLIGLEGELEGKLGINVPGVNGSVPIKYEITLQRGFEASPGDVKPINRIALFFNRGTDKAIREKTKPYKLEIEALVRKAFYGD